MFTSLGSTALRRHCVNGINNPSKDITLIRNTQPSSISPLLFAEALRLFRAPSSRKRIRVTAWTEVSEGWIICLLSKTELAVTLKLSTSCLTDANFWKA